MLCNEILSKMHPYTETFKTFQSKIMKKESLNINLQCEYLFFIS